MKERTPSREGLRTVAIPVRPDLHRRLKIAAAVTDTTLEKLCRAAFEKHLTDLQVALRSAAPQS
ncbi:MAG: hypothetical protein WA268_20015 [Xanthobacteraceae bacterium]